MAERATEQITIGAAPERVFDVAVDFQRYPEWAADIEEVEIEERDEDGRGTSVRYRTAGGSSSTPSRPLTHDERLGHHLLHRLDRRTRERGRDAAQTVAVQMRRHLHARLAPTGVLEHPASPVHRSSPPPDAGSGQSYRYG